MGDGMTWGTKPAGTAQLSAGDGSARPPQPSLVWAGGTQWRPAAVPGDLLSQRRGDGLPRTGLNGGQNLFCVNVNQFGTRRGGQGLGQIYPLSADTLYHPDLHMNRPNRLISPGRTRLPLWPHSGYEVVKLEPVR